MTVLFIIAMVLLAVLTVREEITLDAFILIALLLSKMFVETL